MPLYQYKAATADGEIVKGTLTGSNRDQVVEHIQALGHVPIRVDESTQTTVVKGRRRLRSRRITDQDIANLTRELGTLLRAGMPLAHALKLALLADTASITIMEIVDNLVMLAIPGAMDAPLSSGLFWGSLAFSLAVAGVAAFPVVRWLIVRGKGHAVVHAHHGH